MLGKYKCNFLNIISGDGPTKAILKKMLLVMALINVAFCLLSLITGVHLNLILGLWVGYFYVCLSYIYLSEVVERAVDKTEQKAKRSLISCYAIRYAGLFMLCFLAGELKILSMLGVVIPQLYPKIALGIISFAERKANSNKKSV